MDFLKPALALAADNASTVHEWSTHMDTNSLAWSIGVIGAVVSVAVGVIVWFIVRDRQQIADGIKAADTKAAAASHDLGEHKLWAAENYISRNTLMDMVIEPMAQRHSEMKSDLKGLGQKVDAVLVALVEKGGPK